MARLTEPLRQRLLQQVESIGSGGHADYVASADFAQGFCPIPEHIRALEPDVAIVLGERGAGKTELFSALFDQKARLALTKFAPNDRVARRISIDARWVQGYDRSAAFPDAAELIRFVRSHNFDKYATNRLWFAYLLRVLRPHFTNDQNRSLKSLMSQPAADAQANFASLETLGPTPTVCLDALDERLVGEDRYLIVAYDALDAFGAPDSRVPGVGTAGLLSLWAQYVRRWKRIRPKIFLRTDLFRSNSGVLGADFSKLAALRAEIAWTDSFLYTLLIKRLMNAGEDLREFLSPIRQKTVTDDYLGIVPVGVTPQNARPVVERLSSPYMGANRKKGLTYRWILDHCRDGNGRALPRAFIQLLEFAATHERQSTRRPPQLIYPPAFRRALDDVSFRQYDQARDEWAWIDGLRARVTGWQVPMTRDDFVDCLAGGFDKAWGVSNQKETEVRPPAESPRELVEKLIELGVVQARAGATVDVPDLYSIALGLKRKGGVARS